MGLVPHKTIKGLLVGETIEDLLGIVGALGQKASDIHNGLSQFKGDDTRLWLCRSIWYSVTICCVQLRLCLLGGVNEQAYMWTFGADNFDQAWERRTGIQRSAKITFNIEIQFAIEVVLECILKANLPDTKIRGFKDIAKKVLELSGLPDQKDKFETLYVPAMMRNSLHAAGVHTTESYPAIDIGGVTYEFKKGESVECITLDSLVHAYMHGLDILLEIIKSPASTRFPQLLDPMKRFRAEQVGARKDPSGK